MKKRVWVSLCLAIACLMMAALSALADETGLPVPQISLDRETVVRGEFLAVRITNLQDYADYREAGGLSIRAMPVYGAETYGSYEWNGLGSETGTIWVPTQALNPQGHDGPFTLRVNAQYYGENAQNEAEFSVTEPEEGTLQFAISETEVLTRQDYLLSVYAPGASRIEIYDPWGCVHQDNSDQCEIQYGYNYKGTYAYYARAYFEEADLWRVSDTCTVEVTAPYGNVACSGVEMPSVLRHGSALTLDIGENSGFESWNLNIRRARDDREVWHSWGEPGESVSVPAVMPGPPEYWQKYDALLNQDEEIFEAGEVYHVELGLFKTGWHGYTFSVPLMVEDEDAHDSAISVTVNGQTESLNLAVYEEAHVHVQGPAAATALSVYDGHEWRFMPGSEADYDWNWWTVSDIPTFLFAARYTMDAFTDEDLNSQEFDWNEFEWSGISNTVQLHTLLYGRLPEPEIELNRTAFDRGEWIEAVIANLEDYEDWEDISFFGAPYYDPLEQGYGREFEWNGETLLIPTGDLDPEGKPEPFTLHVSARLGEGWIEGLGTADFTVSEPEEGSIQFGLPHEEEALTSQDIPFSVYAPGASHLKVEAFKQEDPGWRNDWDGDGNYREWTFSTSDSGTYLFKMTAWIEGNEVVSEPVELAVKAPYGPLGLPEISGIPSVLPVGNGVNGSFKKVSGAGDYHIEVNYQPEGGDREFIQECFRMAEDSPEFSFPAECFQRPGMYQLSVHAHGRGYDGGHENQMILVVENGLTQDLILRVNGKTEDIEGWLSFDLLHMDIEMPPEVTALRIWNGDSWGYLDAQEFGRDGGLDWAYQKGTYVFVAQATVAEPVWRQENFDWEAFDWNQVAWTHLSNSVRVRVAAPYGSLTVPTVIAPVSVVRGEWLQVSVQADEQAQFYDIRVFHTDEAGREDGCVYETGHRMEGVFTIPTVYMTAGESYHVLVWTNAPGYESTRSEELVFTVQENEESLFLVSATEVLTNEDFVLSVLAPGAGRVRVTRDADSFEEENGEQLTRTQAFDEPGEYVLKALAAVDPDNPEAGWNVIGEPVTVHVSAPYGKLDVDIAGPDSVDCSGTAEFTVTWHHEGHEYFPWAALNNQDWEMQKMEEVSFVRGKTEDIGTYRIQGSDLQEGEVYILEAELNVLDAGFARSRIRRELPAVSGTPQGSIAVEKTEVLKHEQLQVSVSVPGATALYLHTGQGQWRGFIGSSCTTNVEFGQTGTMQVYARYTTQSISDPREVRYEELTWTGITEVVPVQVTALGTLKRPDFELETEIVPRGEPFRFTFNTLQDKDEWYMGELRDMENRPVDRDYFWDEENGTLNVETILVEPGLYYLDLWTDAVGYEGCNVRLFVSVEEAESDILVSLPDSLLTEEMTRITAYAKDAVQIEMRRTLDADPEVTSTLVQEGPVFDQEVFFSRGASVWQVVFTATYADGSTKSTEPAFVEVKAPYGRRPAPKLVMNSVWMQGQDLHFRIDAGSALLIAADILELDGSEEENYVYEDENLRYWDDPQGWEYRIPAETFIPGMRYELSVMSSEAGYEYTSTEFILAMLPEDAGTFTLPSMLTQIEEEAFSGIAAQKIVIPGTVEEIGAGAFADCGNLLLVELQADPSGIQSGAFDRSGPFMVYGSAGSEAEAWASGMDGCTFITLEP